MNERTFFNDEQVILPLAFLNKKFHYCKNVISNYNKRFDSEYFTNQVIDKKTNYYTELFNYLQFENFDTFLKIFDAVCEYKSNLSELNKKREYIQFRALLKEYICYLKQNNLYNRFFILEENHFFTGKLSVILS